MSKGKVYITGAGPGDPKLISVKGLEALKLADVILYDRLANDELLSVCKPSSEKIFVGKAAGRHFVKQEDTIRMMIEKTRQGKTVVRLKGGDPYIFGRGSEEALALIEEGIDYEVIPGVTAAIGASCYAGIPLTHRNLVTQTVFITAHEAPGKADTQVDWATLAKLKNTNLCIYMGVARIKEVVEILLQNGIDPNTPAAAIQNGTLPSQRSIMTALSDLADEIHKNDLKPPVLTIIGPTANMKNELSWFEDKPLFGRRIVSTRAADQKQSLFELLTNRGAYAIPFSVIKTDISIPEESVRQYLKINYDWIVFTSENGVRYFFELLAKENLDARVLSNTKIAAIGSGTGNKIKEFSLIPDFIPEKYTSASLIHEFPKKYDIKGRHFLRVKGDFDRDPLTDGLLDLGAKVSTIEVYKIMKDSPSEEIINDLKVNGADAYLFTSISTVNNFFNVIGEAKALDLLSNGIALAIGPVTANALKEKGVINITESEVHTIQGMAKKLEELFA
jgi:uroporphyrinogen III methyltransferase / synthase